MEDKRITQKDIARHLEVSIGTVSLALRNDARISERVRGEVKAAAREMGYSPDPMLRSLADYRRKTAPAGESRGQCIAYLLPACYAEEGRSNETLQGVEDRARSLGYKVEVLPWDGTKQQIEQFLRVCYNRGIRGLLLQVPFQVLPEWNLDVSRFSVVHVNGPPSSELTSVCSSHFESARLAANRLREAGYRRFGLVLDERHPEHGMVRQQAGFDTTLRRSGIAEGCALHTLPAQRRLDTTIRNLEAWIRKNRLDCVVVGGTGEGLGDSFESIRRSCKGAFGYAVLDIYGRIDSELTGIDIRRRRIGEEAVSVLNSRLSQNYFGVESAGAVTMVRGVWRTGKTAPGIRQAESGAGSVDTAF